MAMLAKQARRFIQNYDSLVTRTYKEKYFPKTSFLEAKIGNNLSVIWRSILESQEVIRKGGKWRIGDRKSVRIWEES